MYLVFYRLFRKNPNAQQSNHENQGTGQSLLILDEIKHQDMHDVRAAQVTELNLASIVTGRKVNILQMINFCCKNIIFGLSKKDLFSVLPCCVCLVEYG